MSAGGDADDGAPHFDDGFFAGFLTLLRWRRDVRSFDPRTVPDAELALALAACDLAPSVGNSQPWRFVTVADPQRRAAVRASFLRCNAEALAAQPDDRAPLYARLKLEGLDTAPVHLAVFCDEGTTQGHGLGIRTMREMLRYSVVTAIHNFWLAARCRGLGVGWVSIIEPDVVAAALDVPTEWQLVAYLCVGYPRALDDVPELEREGWQARSEGGLRLIQR
ncbi:MAG: 5,6-dimethylbenzimidazole synthase [Aurantimonas endophytica]|uniref:5,6-dimethylbenzimidazole synthase n=1 Tax=Aurantimonas endophytica TaxID=1522175 RepID=UPI0030027270